MRCVNVHSADEKITFYVDGLNESIKTLVARYLGKERQAKYI